MSYEQGFEILVIGDWKNPRNPDLVKILRSSGIPYGFVDPIFVDEETAHFFPGQKLNRALYGRRLLQGEIGCALAHRIARQRITQKWALILEDDAVISQDSIRSLPAYFSALGHQNPIIISLFNGVETNLSRNSVRRIRHMPSSTLAYVATSAVQALESDHSRQIGTADWPLDLASARFYALWGLGVHEYDSKSLVDSDGLRLGNRAYYLRALSLIPIFLFKYGWAFVYFSVISPLTRDLGNRIRRTFDAGRTLRSN